MVYSDCGSRAGFPCVVAGIPFSLSNDGLEIPNFRIL
jgi:hypothetical protein